MKPKITRFEVIDHTAKSRDTENQGRRIVHYGHVELSYQDGDQTLKVFLIDKAPDEKK